ncbi:extracellular solute-binding protein [bacterium]|nr:extracellular solute-binding protein [bacterium]
MPRNNAGPLALLASVSAVVLLVLWWSTSSTSALVVYCAHDAVYSDEILEEFERQTGIQVEPRFDTEATKSLGLVQLIQRERAHPQCDVIWNNELLGTLALQAEGLLEPYQGPGWERIPPKFRDPQGNWVGIGARLRVWIVNHRQMTASESDIAQLLELEPSRIAMAQPMFGTTLTHYCVLAREWGLPRLQEWHADLRLRDLREVPGNGLVKDLVAAGTCDAGWTDTDDTFVAKDAGFPVDMLPIRVSRQTIAIPNTVAIIRGTKHRQEAEQLVDFLTSKEIELRLAKSTARQIPLGPTEAGELPDDVRQLATWASESVELGDLLPIRGQVLDWLRQEYAP